MNRNKHLAIPLIVLIIGIIFISLSFFPYHKTTPVKERHAYGGVYRYAHSASLTSLDPREAVFSVQLSSVIAIFDPLIRTTKDMRLMPSICKSWAFERGGRSFVCHIREGVKFHDGKELNSEDVVFSLHYMSKKGGLNLETESLSNVVGMKEYWEGRSSIVEGIKAEGKYTVRIDLLRPCPHFAYILSSPRYVVFPDQFNGMRAEEFFKRPVGTGPFMFLSMQDNTLSLKANGDYFDSRPYLDGVVYQYCDSKEDAFRRFRNKEVDDISYYHPTEVPDDVDHARYHLSDSFTSLIVFPNNSRPPFDNRLLRQLLFSAIDRDDVVGKCYKESESAKMIIPRGMIGYVRNAAGVRYDMKRARDLLREVKDQRIVIPPTVIYALETDLTSCAADVIADNLRELGLPWQVEYTSSDNLARLFFNGTMDAEIELIGSKSDDPYSVLRFFSSENSENLARINDSLVDRLLRDVKLETDPLQRVKLYRQIDAQISYMDYALSIVSPRIYKIWSNMYTRTGAEWSRHICNFTSISREDI